MVFHFHTRQVRKSFWFVGSCSQCVVGKSIKAQHRNEVKKNIKLDNEVASLRRQRLMEECEMERTKLDQRALRNTLSRHLNEQRREEETVNAYSKARESQTLQQVQYEQEKKLAFEMEKIRREEIKEVKLRQKLRETCLELRELETKLRRAYIAKELSAQLAEKEAARIEEKIRMNSYQQYLRAEAEKEKERLLEKEKEEFRRKLEYRKELQDQLIASEKMKQQAYYDFMEEKKAIDEIVQKIYEEDRREMEERMIKMQKSKQEMDEFNRAREEFKQKEKREIEEENRRLLEFMEQQNMKQQDTLKGIREKEEMKAAVINKLAQQIYEEDLRKQEREEILQELKEAEERDRIEREGREEMEKRLRQRIELRSMARQQTEERLEKLRQEAEQERQYREQMLQQFAENERLEQMTAAKQRQKKLEYRLAVDRMMAEQRKRRTEEMQRLLQEQELWLKSEADRRKMIEEERLRMLKEHAAALLGFLPKGVLRQDDLPHLGSEFLEKYSKLNIGEGPETETCRVHPPETN
ncbi:meiosis-specific nuclear structural protein 1 [Anabrus simplex]|uniref:meiosis-specific nuclear structural protein 1 n=1 Tax=Anabrus simplex TaxID=316456 RepID=UPI0035A3326E